MRIQIPSYHYVFINYIHLLVYSIFRCYILLKNDSNRKRGSQVFGSLHPNIGRVVIITKLLYSPHDKTSMWRKGIDLPTDSSRRNFSMSRFNLIYMREVRNNTSNIQETLHGKSFRRFDSSLIRSIN